MPNTLSDELTGTCETGELTTMVSSLAMTSMSLISPSRPCSTSVRRGVPYSFFSANASFSMICTQMHGTFSEPPQQALVEETDEIGEYSINVHNGSQSYQSEYYYQRSKCTVH